MSKTILITGTSSGFGKLMTKTLLDQGHTVIATMRDLEGRNAPGAQEIRSMTEDQSKLTLIDLDVLNNDSVDTAIEEALNHHDRIDVLVNNAGYGVGGITEGFTDDQAKRIMDVNLIGVHRATRAILPHFRENKAGLIVNVSSIMGRIVIPFSSFYTASKYALEGYSESLRYELRPLGIDVSIIEPGGYGTGFLGNMGMPADESRVSEYGEYAEVPGQMWGGFAERLSSAEAPDPQDIANVLSDLVNQPNGERPLRVVSDPMLGGGGAVEINDVTDKAEHNLLENMGMSNML